MKWLSFLSKPAWESADAGKRAAAVAHESHPDLVRRIADFARHDADADVRKAAVRRLDDLSLLADRARLDASAEVRELARQRLRQHLLDANTPIEQRQRQVRVTEDSDLLETVAVQAPETDLRRAAMERIKRMGLIVDRCLKDPDPQLRRELLDRIEEGAALERVAEAARKSDKQLARLARERLAEIRLRSGDADAIRQRAEAICGELETFLRQRPLDLGARLDAVQRDWQALVPAPEAALLRRYAGLTETLRHMLEVAARPPVEKPVAATGDIAEEKDNGIAADAVPPLEAVEDAEDPALRDALQALAAAGDLDEAALERFTQSIRAAHAAAPRCPSNDALRRGADALLLQQRQRLQQLGKDAERARAAAHAAITDYAHAVEAGRLSEARAARQKAHQLHALVATPDRDHKRMEQADAAFDQLARWQRWSNDTQRKRICDEIEAVMGSGEHPDALLSRIKAAQAEWTRLEESEREPGQPEPPPSGLAKRFRVLCARAIAPARPYLEKRSNLRAQKRDEVLAMLTAVEQAIQSADAGTDLFALRKQAIDALRLLDEVPPQERRKLSERLRAAKETLDQRITGSRAEAEAEKRKFIAQVRRRIGQAEGADAINAAKDAMARWKTLPRGDRRTEDALWAELRAVVDPVFDRSKAERAELELAEAAERAAIQALIAEAATLSTSDHDAHALETRLATLQQRWREQSARSRDDERAFDRQVEAIEAQRRQRQQAGARRARELAIQLQAVVVAAEPAALADARRRIESEPLAAADRAALLSHCAEREAAGVDESGDALEYLRYDCVLAELLAGVESPADQQALRKQVQIQRLADKLGGVHADAGEEARELWLRWLGTGGVAAGDRAGLDARMQAALRKLFA
jgi:exonuclease SbcC